MLWLPFLGQFAHAQERESQEKREPPSSPCVSPISSRASRTRAPTPVARSRRVTPRTVSSVFASPMPLKVADPGSLD